jgi:HlyD family secretion protein
MKQNKIHPGALAPAGILVTWALLSACGAKSKTAVYEFANVGRGTLEKTVSSTGTLNPVATVKVLPRMSGKVEKIYTDFNALVSRGEVLAELNTDMLRLQREQQMASVVKARANYELQLLNYRNQEKLAEKNLISEYEFKNSKTTLDIQAAELSAAEASLKVIETEINQYAYITSPIDGIVLDRTINEGDTVVDSSSSNSSAIFTLAENLTEMQIESWVGELDIFSIREGQEVRFTLESLPGRTYLGTVESKRLMPSVQDNVVSYSVVIKVNNQDGSLLPGMSCSLEFIEERNENILLVPNAALRFQPPELKAGEIEELVFNAGLEGMDETQRAAATAARTEALKQAQSSENRNTAQAGLAGLTGFGGMPGGGGPGGPDGPGRMTFGGNSGAPGNQAGQSRTGEGAPVTPKPLWYLGSGGKPAVVLVVTGISDGSRTEVRPLNGNRDLEGMQVIVREKVQP